MMKMKTNMKPKMTNVKVVVIEEAMIERENTIVRVVTNDRVVTNAMMIKNK